MTGGRGDPGLLDRMVRGSLGWLDEARGFFRLPPNVTTDADPNLTLKPLGELAELTQLIGVLHPRDEIRQSARGLFAFAWNETRDGELFAELIHGEPFATYPVELYGTFAQAGLRHADADALVQTTTRLRGWRVAREDHTRTLNVLNAERRLGLRQHADFASVLALTGLGRLPEPWTLDRKSVYGVTHDVFHLTDWGRNRQRLSPEFAGYLRLWLPSWLDTWLEEEMWDLVGELLAVTACLPAAPFDPVAWQRLATAQAADGSVPEIGAAPSSGDPAEAFLACYHSTLVTAFAATLARIACDEAEAGPVAGDPALVGGRTPCESENAP
ncbi:hypothetical protein BX264_0658 [Streptomyces sp. 2333.5]|uniref:DUF6895 family protein n=1 Tax=Streptomyces TaxID=1883 RepID=UPI00089945AB|nr:MULTISPECIES: hypothetical protein [unclassified Streptomyces]PJJ00379.1 hypothetical protein BX264_0658 [Streptomyces sp. 2333.5]SEB89961.1 hypothetical protein SAMN05428943_0659 [Streptomyces sp. 2314.4]SEC78595.1 hypothetical protein SAMN05428942_0658 [Streptomyces sp. 2112.2]SOE15506.1 hypothetical protein SAMN06272775_6414 [Streptomyces sp. 2323.1]